jgi:hypothetical protein
MSKNTKQVSTKKNLASTPNISPDEDADKTGTDVDSDKTQTGHNKGHDKNKFDKPKRERNPDTTGIDIQPDKTK